MGTTLLILLLGTLRIIQANCNKQTSGFLDTKNRFFRYGAYFDCAAAAFSLVYLCFIGFSGFSEATVLCSVLSALCFVSELITSLEALKRAPLVLCNMCAMGGGIILVSIAGIFFFDEPMSLLQWLGVAVFFTAAYCLSPGGTVRQRQRLTPAVWALLAANFLINGAASFLGKYYAVRVENGSAALFSCLTYTCSSLLFLLLLWGSRKKNTAAHSGAPLPKKLLLFGGILGAACSGIVYLSTTLSRTVPVVVLNTVPSAISIIGCLFVGALLFREKITVRNTAGVLLGILSVVLIVC